MLETRVDLSNDMTWRQMIAVGVRRVVLARGELDKLEGPKYSERRAAELRRARGERSSESKGSADGSGVSERAEAEESDESEDETQEENDESEKTARRHEGRCENWRETAKRDRKRQTPKGGRRLAPHSSP